MQAQASLFDRPPPGLQNALGDATGLRDYQREAIEAAFRRFREPAPPKGPGGRTGTLISLPTGTGKTIIATQLTRIWLERGGQRVLVLAHTDSLTGQMLAAMRRHAGDAAREQAGEHAGRQRIVVASVPTLAALGGRRLERFKSDPFDLIITDETHHSPADTYRLVYSAFPQAQLLGITATAGRKGLGRFYSSVAYKMELVEAIDRAWLTPIHVRATDVEVDLTGVSTNKGTGDFVQGELDEAVARVVAPIAEAAVTMAQGRTLIFCPGVKTAWATVEAINKRMPGSARAVAGKHADGSPMSIEECAQVRDSHKRGDFRFLVNCNKLTEGYDDPGIQYGIIARPTKSWTLAMQMVGRFTRLWPGCEGIQDKAERMAAVAASPKPSITILDIACNSDEHELIGPVDLLGGRYSDAEKKRAKKILAEKGGDPRSALEEARKLERAAAAALAAKTKLTVRDSQAAIRRTTDVHASSLLAWGYHEREIPQDDIEALRLLRRCFVRRKVGLATVKQERALRGYGIPTERMYKSTATQLIGELLKAGGGNWPRDPATVRAIADRVLSAGREPGAEG